MLLISDLVFIYKKILNKIIKKRKINTKKRNCENFSNICNANEMDYEAKSLSKHQILILIHDSND